MTTARRRPVREYKLLKDLDDTCLKNGARECCSQGPSAEPQLLRNHSILRVRFTVGNPPRLRSQKICHQWMARPGCIHETPEPRSDMGERQISRQGAAGVMVSVVVGSRGGVGPNQGKESCILSGLLSNFCSIDLRVMPALNPAVNLPAIL